MSCVPIAKDALLTMEIAKEEDVETLSENLKGLEGLTLS